MGDDKMKKLYIH